MRENTMPSLSTVKTEEHTGSLELVIAHVANMACALKCMEVQEIIKEKDITKVHGAPPYVRGAINLRGHIVSIIDMRIKFGYEKRNDHEDMAIVVVKEKDENIGLLVDSADDILIASMDKIEAPPANIKGVGRNCFRGVFKKEDDLVAILNVSEILTLAC